MNTRELHKPLYWRVSGYFPMLSHHDVDHPPRHMRDRTRGRLNLPTRFIHMNVRYYRRLGVEDFHEFIGTWAGAQQDEEDRRERDLNCPYTVEMTLHDQNGQSRTVTLGGGDDEAQHDDYPRNDDPHYEQCLVCCTPVRIWLADGTRAPNLHSCRWCGVMCSSCASAHMLSVWDETGHVPTEPSELEVARKHMQRFLDSNPEHGSLPFYDADLFRPIRNASGGALYPCCIGCISGVQRHISETQVEEYRENRKSWRKINGPLTPCDTLGLYQEIMDQVLATAAIKRHIRLATLGSRVETRSMRKRRLEHAGQRDDGAEKTQRVTV